jgi:hypothetical protein
MQLVRATSTAAVILLLGTIIPAYAQRDRKDEKRDKGRAQHEQSQPQKQRAKPSQHREQRQRAEGTPQQRAVEWQKSRGWLKHGGWQGRGSWRAGRARNWAREHRTWAQRGGYGGYIIPHATFSLHFGRQHWFRMRARPTFYMGYPRFSYGGFSFLLVDPWPEHWAENWFDTGELCIVYDDGYYLYDRRHPGIGLAMVVIR